MKYLSLFTGIGGFELGIERAYEKLCIKKQGEGVQGTGGTERLGGKRPNVCADRLSCIGYSEIDKYAVQIFEKHYPSIKNYGDITKIKAEELPDFDLLVGGFPCQAFSIAGRRGGFGDTRGTLYFEIARIVREKQPRLLLLENVKGLLSHDKGKTFTTIVHSLDELGYDCQWQVLNSKDFGVPQNRERVFIVGHLRGTPRPEVFPFGGEDREDVQASGEKQEGGSWVSTLDARYGERWSSETYVRTDKSDTQKGGTKSDGLNRIRRTPYTDGSRVRRLTPLECERLQGFPDNWTEGLSDTQKYKVLGNAVTVNVIQEIMEKIL